MEPSANDFGAINARLAELYYDRIRRGQPCELKKPGGRSVDCWCAGMGKNGAALPCPKDGA